MNNDTTAKGANFPKIIPKLIKPRTMAKYIGLRENLNGPDVKNFGVSINELIPVLS
jgi:hypothetical protein